MHSSYGLEIVENCERCKLRRGRLFCDLPRPSLNALQQLGFATACPKGTMLFAQDQAPHDVAVVCAGHVKIYTGYHAGKKVCVGIAGPGTVLGLTAAISGSPHQVSIEALEPCQLRIVKADRLLSFLHNDNAACFAAAMCLSKEVQKMNNCLRLIGLSQPAIQRLVQVLICWDIHEEDEPQDRRHLLFPLTHKEFAEIIGASRETVTRLFSAFERRHIIHRSGTTLVIKDERTLRNLASSAAG